jgi:hypothetical protein
LTDLTIAVLVESPPHTTDDGEHGEKKQQDTAQDLPQNLSSIQTVHYRARELALECAITAANDSSSW